MRYWPAETLNKSRTGRSEEKRERRFSNSAPMFLEKREPRQVEVLAMNTQHSPSGKVFTRACVPEKEPERVHSPVGLVSFQPREKVSAS